MTVSIDSIESPLRVDFVSSEMSRLHGRLGMTLAPGKRDPHALTADWDRDLRTDLHRLRDEYRTDLLVSMLQPHELDRLGIPHLFLEARAAGLEVESFPVFDGGTPASMDRTINLVMLILARVEAGQTVVIHCRGGLGRTGTLTACCLAAHGAATAEAIAAVRQARSPRAIEPGQEGFVAAFKTAWGNRAGS